MEECNEFHEFIIKELMQSIGVYLYQGISPSLQVDMKFYYSSNKPINGSDFFVKILEDNQAMQSEYIAI